MYLLFKPVPRVEYFGWNALRLIMSKLSLGGTSSGKVSRPMCICPFFTNSCSFCSSALQHTDSPHTFLQLSSWVEPSFGGLSSGLGDFALKKGQRTGEGKGKGQLLRSDTGSKRPKKRRADPSASNLQSQTAEVLDQDEPWVDKHRPSSQVITHITDLNAFFFFFLIRSTSVVEIQSMTFTIVIINSFGNTMILLP